LIEGDPTELVDISPLIPADYEAERSRILSPAELLELHNRFQQMTADYGALSAGQKYEGIRPLKKETQLALWISLGTLCRIGELLQAERKNVYLERQTWFLPSKTSKALAARNRTTMSSSPPSQADRKNEAFQILLHRPPQSDVSSPMRFLDWF